MSKYLTRIKYNLIMEFIKDIREYFEDYFQKRRRNKVNAEAFELARQEKYAEAAEVYMRFAPELLKYSQIGYGELMYCIYCRYAFELLIKAKDAEKSLEQARKTLEILLRNDGKWLKDNSGAQAKDILAMVGDLYIAGFAAEAEILAKEVNDQLEKYNIPLRSVVGAVPKSPAEPILKSKFPPKCSHCGAKIPYSPNEDAIECSYCETVIYAR